MPIKATLVVGSTIGLLIFGLYALAAVITGLLELPSTLNLQPALRLAGGAMFTAGLGIALWLFRYRSPSSMIVSTYFTFMKMFARAPIFELRGRTEPLITGGPQKYVRHPLYFGVVNMFLGWALLTAATASLIAVVFILLLLRFVQIPFEERELYAIFGDDYARYPNKVPMLVPFTRLRRARDRTQQSRIGSRRVHSHAAASFVQWRF